jgi:hypothetical protein
MKYHSHLHHAIRFNACGENHPLKNALLRKKSLGGGEESVSVKRRTSEKQ